MHQNNLDLEEDYLDWFFLSKFGKGVGYWKNLPEEKIESIMVLEHEKEQAYWDTWVKIYSKIYGK